LLHAVLSFELFWLIVASSAVANVAVFNMSVKCTETGRYQTPCKRMLAEFLNIMTAFLASCLTCEALLTVERTAIESRWDFVIGARSESYENRFLEAVVAVFGLSAAGAGWCFLFRQLALEVSSRRRDVQRVQRKIQAKTWWAPRATDVVLSRSDARLAPCLGGDCAICLGSLVNSHHTSSLSANAAAAADAGGSAPSSKEPAPVDDEALLRLPCEHIFHDTCAAEWVLREDACPLCRRVVGNLGQCERLHVVAANHGTPSAVAIGVEV